MGTTIGVISDTHGLLRPEAESAFACCSAIIHAGDIGHPKVLDNLRKIAPVHAVRGNIDRGIWAGALPETVRLEVESAKLFLLHKIETLPIDPSTEGLNAVIFGHSHMPSQELRNGVLFLNPGSAGPKRFHLPVTVALLHIDGIRVEVEPITFAV